MKPLASGTHIQGCDQSAPGPLKGVAGASRSLLQQGAVPPDAHWWWGPSLKSTLGGQKAVMGCGFDSSLSLSSAAFREPVPIPCRIQTDGKSYGCQGMMSSATARVRSGSEMDVKPDRAKGATSRHGDSRASSGSPGPSARARVAARAADLRDTRRAPVRLSRSGLPPAISSHTHHIGHKPTMERAQMTPGSPQCGFA